MERPYYVLFLSLSLLLMMSGATATNSSASESSKTIIKELDQATWISDINWNPENSSQIKVTVHSEIPKPVGIQEMPDYTGKSGDFAPMDDRTLQAGKNILYVPVNGRMQLGIALTDSDDGIYYKKSAGLILTEIGLPLLFFSGFTGFILTISAEYWYVKRTTSKVQEGSGVLI